MTKPKPKFNFKRLILVYFIPVFAILLGIAIFYMTVTPSGKGANEKTVLLQEELPEKLIVHDAPKALPELAFTDAVGARRSLADYRGQVVVLNFWASWCAPCREEMLSLDALQGQFTKGRGREKVKILALSLDRGKPDRPLAFLADLGVQWLIFLHDAKSETAQAAGVFGLPTTLVIDPQGREIARLLGAAEWNTPVLRDFIESYVQ